MREVKIVAWCDACPSDKQSAAVRSFTVGSLERDEVGSDGGDRPALFTLDLCAKHAENVIDPLAKLLTEAVPFHPPAKLLPKVGRPPLAARGQADERADASCEICGAVVRRSSLLTHIWHVHRPGDTRPAAPALCPDCGEAMSGPTGMGVHRRMAHDWDPVGEAYAGIRRPH